MHTDNSQPTSHEQVIGITATESGSSASNKRSIPLSSFWSQLPHHQFRLSTHGVRFGRSYPPLKLVTGSVRQKLPPPNRTINMEFGFSTHGVRFGRSYPPLKLVTGSDSQELPAPQTELSMGFGLVAVTPPQTGNRFGAVRITPN